MKRAVLVTIVIILLIASGQALASLINGSFETGPSLPALNNILPINGSGIDGWNVVSGAVDWVGTNYWNSSSGNYSLDMTSGVPGAISQTFDTQKDMNYSVSFDLSVNPYLTGTVRLQVDIFDGSGGSLFSNYYDESNVKGSNTVPGFTGMNWDTETFTFIAASGLSKIVFTSASANTLYYGPAIDNVVVTEVGAGPSPVPEPTTLLLLGAGLIGLAGYGRKKLN